MAIASAIERIRPSVFQVSVDATLSSGAHRTIIVGTAFAVADGWLVTADHVVAGVERLLAEHPDNKFWIAFAGPSVDTPGLQLRANFVGSSAVVVARDDVHDLALVRTSTGSFGMFRGTRWGSEGAMASDPRAVRLALERPRDGEPVAVSGYPLDEPTMVTNAGIVGSAWAMDRNQPDLVDLYLGDFTANPGNSGGPVYKADSAAVIGMCVAGRNAPIQGTSAVQKADLTVVVPSRYIAELLEANSVDVPAAKPLPPQGSRGKKRR